MLDTSMLAELAGPEVGRWAGAAFRRGHIIGIALFVPGSTIFAVILQKSGISAGSWPWLKYAFNVFTDVAV
jgi:hypothetical protein